MRAVHSPRRPFVYNVVHNSVNERNYAPVKRRRTKKTMTSCSAVTRHVTLQFQSITRSHMSTARGRRNDMESLDRRLFCNVTPWAADVGATVAVCGRLWSATLFTVVSGIKFEFTRERPMPIVDATRCPHATADCIMQNLLFFTRSFVHFVCSQYMSKARDSMGTPVRRV